MLRDHREQVVEVAVALVAVGVLVEEQPLAVDWEVRRRVVEVAVEVLFASFHASSVGHNHRTDRPSLVVANGEKRASSPCVDGSILPTGDSGLGWETVPAVGRTERETEQRHCRVELPSVDWTYALSHLMVNRRPRLRVTVVPEERRMGLYSDSSVRGEGADWSVLRV